MGIVQSTNNPPQLWTNQYLSNLATKAEIQISTEVPCIYVRFPMNVLTGIGVYDMTTACPTYHRLTGVIRITYQGWTVHPVFQEQLRNIVVPLKPENGDVISSRPTMFMRTGYGIDGLKLYPAPNIDITYNGTDDVYAQTGITNNVIISGWRIADPTGNTYRIPDYIRETLVRYYVMARAYKKEGKGQDLTASKYFENKYQVLLKRFKTIVSQLFSSRLNFKWDPFMNTYGHRPPHPRLPSNFGTPLGRFDEF